MIKGDYFILRAVDDVQRPICALNGGLIVKRIECQRAHKRRRKRLNARESANCDKKIKLVPGRQIQRDAAAKAVANNDQASPGRYSVRIGQQRIRILRNPPLAGSPRVAAISPILRCNQAIARVRDGPKPSRRVRCAIGIAMEHEDDRLLRFWFDEKPRDVEAIGSPHLNQLYPRGQLDFVERRCWRLEYDPANNERDCNNYSSDGEKGGERNPESLHVSQIALKPRTVKTWIIDGLMIIVIAWMRSEEPTKMASSVNLGKALEAFIDEAVESGRYGSRSEVLREGVRLVQDREAKLARFDAEMLAAHESIARDGGIDADEVFDRLIAKYEAQAAKKAA
jgi:antitoxin ParD1/3/4